MSPLPAITNRIQLNLFFNLIKIIQVYPSWILTKEIIVEFLMFAYFVA
ncbi:hypothetical protein TrispH2_005393 [Trichoplax sp. H2]|nr:hypothetical protein TrispH2_005393 [Trichoplax sp. H2]|eukprot:RDD43049.1 hypothetical protein TrispH2_005393 [Trichoplax sp. H2]